MAIVKKSKNEIGASLKADRVVIERIEFGREFHNRGAATENARAP